MRQNREEVHDAALRYVAVHIETPVGTAAAAAARSAMAGDVHLQAEFINTR